MSFKEYNMDLDWKFQIDQSTQKQIKGHSAVYTATKNGNASGSAGKEFADRDWESVNLPHDYLLLLILTQIVAEYTDIESAIMLGTGKVLY